MTRVKAPWCVVVAEGVSDVVPQTHMHCQRCGAREVPALPADVMVFVRQCDRFTRDHSQCQGRGATQATAQLKQTGGK